MTELTTSQAPSALGTIARRHNAQIAATLDMTKFRKPISPITCGDRAAAWALLDRALAASSLVAEAFDRGKCIIIIEVPSLDWVRPVRDALEAHLSAPVEFDDAFFQALAQSLDFDNEAESPPPQEQDEPVRPEWVWLSAPTDRINDWTSVDIDRIAAGLRSGKGAIIVTTATDSLPSPIRLSADHHLVLPALDGAAMAIAAHVLSGSYPATTIDDDHCCHLTPDLLRMSHRPGEDGDDWIRRLRSMTNAAAQIVRYEGPKLIDLYGMDDAKQWGLNLQADIKEYLAGRLPWKDVDRGCLLVGEPGTGKTSFARRLAGTIGLPLVTGSHSEWQAAGHLGQMLSAMRRTFEQARAQVPAILFIDEIDSFADRQSLRHSFRDYAVQVVNALLELTDGALDREGVVILAAANSLNVDPALIRPGRLDRVIEVPLPDDRALAHILRQHLGPNHLPGLDLLPFVAGLTASGASCELWARDAKREARLAGRPMVPDDLSVHIPRPEAMPSALHFQIAVHEAGHAIAGAVEMPGMVQLVRVDGAHAGVQFELGQFRSQADARREIRILLAGRAAEQLRLGSVGFGSGGPAYSDLARATSLAATMLASHGLGEHLLWLGDASPDNIPSFLSAHPSLRDQVSRILDEEHERALAILRPRLSIIDKVATALVEHGSLTGAEVEELVASMHIAQELVP